MTDSVREDWTRITNWFQKNSPNALVLNPPATEAEIADAEAKLGQNFPPDFRASLALHNGQQVVEDFNWLPGTGHMLSLQEIVEKWQDEQTFYEGEPDGFDEFMSDDRVRFCLYHKGRIQFVNSEYGDGDAMYLDFVPGPEGDNGQIIVMVSECEFEPVGINFGDFLRKYANLLESGKVRVSSDDGMIEIMPTEDGEYSLVPLLQ